MPGGLLAMVCHAFLVLIMFTLMEHSHIRCVGMCGRGKRYMLIVMVIQLQAALRGAGIITLVVFG